VLAAALRRQGEQGRDCGDVKDIFIGARAYGEPGGGVNRRETPVGDSATASRSGPRPVSGPPHQAPRKHAGAEDLPPGRPRDDTVIVASETWMLPRAFTRLRGGQIVFSLQTKAHLRTYGANMLKH